VSGQSVDSGILSIQVLPGVSRLKILNPPASIVIGRSYTFTAQAYDQFNNPMSTPIQWTSSAGSMSASSLQVNDFVRSIRVTATARTNPAATDSVEVAMLTEGAVRENLDQAKAYPVPFKGNMGQPGVTFSNLVVGTKIRIFTTDGRIVRTLRSDNGDDVVWTIDTDSGSRASSGVYLYQIDGKGQKKKGKLVLIL
jgi:hypothetical protein